MIGAIICFSMSAVNVGLIFMNPNATYVAFNWASALFCFGFGLGVACAVVSTER